jgi:diguanylate cyclase (GGDEF)-like protein/PAS domain S-box-containing protein
MYKYEESNNSWKIEHSETLYKKCVSHISAIVCELSPDGTILFVNDGAINATGYSLNNFLNKNWWNILFEREQKQQVELFYKIFNTTMDVTNFEAAITTKDGIEKVFEWKSSNHYLPDGTLNRIILFGIDVTGRHKLRETLKSMLILDTLTGLFNRRGFFRYMYQRLKEEEEANEMTLIFLHLDNLQTINNSWGYHEGDRALINLAMILKDTFRQTDIIARTGGNEFVVVIKDIYLTEESIRLRLQDNSIMRSDFEQHMPYLTINIDKVICSKDQLLSFEQFSKDIEGIMLSHSKTYQNRINNLLYQLTRV